MYFVMLQVKLIISKAFISIAVVSQARSIQSKSLQRETHPQNLYFKTLYDRNKLERLTLSPLSNICLLGKEPTHSMVDATTALKYQEVIDSDKHSSLLQCRIHLVNKCFVVQAPGLNLRPIRTLRESHVSAETQSQHSITALTFKIQS